MSTALIVANSTTVTNSVTPSVAVDLHRFRYGIGILCTIPVGQSADYDVEVSGDDPGTPDADKNWNKHDILKAKTASANSNLAYPVSAIRVYLRGGWVNVAIVTAE